MKTPKIFIYRNPHYTRCPKCRKAGVLHHSRAKTMKEQIIKKITFYKLYRCKECGWRGFLSTITFTSESVKAIAMYAVLIFISGYLIRLLLTKFLIN